MEKGDFNNWFGGPIIHAHLRGEDQQEKYEGNERYQFTQEAALKYLKTLTGNPEVTITDTNHALLGMDVENLSRPESIPMEVWRKKIIDQASLNTSSRIEKIRNNPEIKNIIVGVEADIIDNLGNLSLNNDYLKQLDFTIASFHRFIWSIFSEKTHCPKKYLVEAFENAVKNPNVVVLGHPTRHSSRVVGELTPADFEPVLNAMNKNKIAYEINLLSDLASNNESLNRDVIKRAVILNVPLIAGSDFHHFEELDFSNGLNVFGGVVNRDRSQQIFENNKDLHFRIFRRLASNIKILNSLGVSNNNIVNSSSETFNKWLSDRKKSS